MKDPVLNPVHPGEILSINLQTRYELDTARLDTAAIIEKTIRPAKALAKVA